MLFNSLGFLFGFLPVVYFGFWRLVTKAQRHVWLAVAGYVFYAFWNYKFCALMLFSTLVSYVAGLGFLRWSDERRRRLCLIVPVTTDLALLAVFKYSNFFFSSAGAALTAVLHRSVAVPVLDVVLPVGISFYTFHTISYIVDSYRGSVSPTRNFFEFMAYVSLFPQLVAGPIVRFGQIERDLDNIDRAERRADLNRAWSFFVIGLAKKVLLADTIAAVVNPALQHYDTLSTPGIWLCMLGYTYQLYFDFSGYSDMAVGLGEMFGLRLPQNFNSPYQAVDIADFWRRWHISLSSCLRDYIYIPLGGNRGGALKVFRNVMVTMLLGGLWHGASWTFVLWGGYHGLLLAIQRLTRASWGRVTEPVRRAFTFALVVIGWTLFRSDGLPMAAALFARMFRWHTGDAVIGGPVLLAFVALSALIAHTGPNTFEMRHEWSPAPAAAFAALTLACLFVLYGSQPSPFLYFQF